MPTVSGLLETSLYVADMAASADFYHRVFGFEELLREDRMCGLAIPGGVLLLFKQNGSLQPSPIPGGVIPPHGATGQSHLCFAIPVAQLAQWAAHLEACGIEIESRVRQRFDGTSLYFRDPDGHSVEVATPGLWLTY